MNTYERAFEDQKVTWPTHVTMVWNATWGSLWLKILGWSPAQPCNHHDTSNVHPVLSKTSPPLGPIHRNPHRGNMRRTTIFGALLILPAGISQKKFNVSACVLHCLCAYVCLRVQKVGGKGGVRWQESRCKCPHSHWLLMNGNCCDDDGETSWRPFLRTTAIWMTGIQHSQKDKWAVWKQSSLFIVVYFPVFHFSNSCWFWVTTALSI